MTMLLPTSITSKSGCDVRVELEAVSRAVRDDDVVVGLNGSAPNMLVQRASALVDEDHLVGGGVAVEFRLRQLGPAAPHGDVGVREQRHAARDRIAGRLHVARLEMMVPQDIGCSTVSSGIIPAASTFRTRVGGRKW